MPSKAFNVYLSNKLIDTVFYSVCKVSIAANCEYVRNSLIRHDGYDINIRVVWPKGQRITETEYVIQGNYGYGWDDENYESTWKDAKRSLKEYRENGTGQYRLIRRRVHCADS